MAPREKRGSALGWFNGLTGLAALPANLLAVPLCALVLMSNLGSLLLAGWFPGAAELFNHAGWFLMECIRVSSQWFANWFLNDFDHTLTSRLRCGGHDLGIA